MNRSVNSRSILISAGNICHNILTRIQYDPGERLWVDVDHRNVTVNGRFQDVFNRKLRR